MMEQEKKKKRVRLGIAGAALAMALVVVWVVWPGSDAANGLLGDSGPEFLEASGVIQVEEIAIASEFGGLIADLAVAEADKVTTGQPLVYLDTAVLDAQIEAAEALVEMAGAGVAQARAGARPGQIAVAEAQLAQAQAGAVAAAQGVSDTLALLETPQDINLQIAVTAAQIESAEGQVAQATALYHVAEEGKDLAAALVDAWGDGGRFKIPVAPEDIVGELPPGFGDLFPDPPPEFPDLEHLPDGDYTFGDWELHVRDGNVELFRWINVTLPSQAYLAPHYWWQAAVGVEAAEISLQGLEASLADLYARRANPQELQAQYATAVSARQEVAAQAAMAQAQVDGLKTGASPEQIAALEARQAQAQAALDALNAQRAMMTLTAPVAGTVLSIAAHPGEVVAQGAKVLSIANLDEVALVVYVPETRLGDLFLDQPVRVNVDSFPERVFAGHVRHISDTAQFTPRNVATQEERVNLVFAVEIRIDNREGLLKPGMPADALFDAGVR